MSMTNDEIDAVFSTLVLYEKSISDNEYILEKLILKLARFEYTEEELISVEYDIDELYDLPKTKEQYSKSVSDLRQEIASQKAFLTKLYRIRTDLINQLKNEETTI